MFDVSQNIFLVMKSQLFFEWNVSYIPIYYQQNISINVVPNPVAIMYAGNRTFQLSLLYNTLYNVSIIQPGLCAQPNQTVFIELNYCKHFTNT